MVQFHAWPLHYRRCSGRSTTRHATRGVYRHITQTLQAGDKRSRVQGIADFAATRHQQVYSATSIRSCVGCTMEQLRGMRGCQFLFPAQPAAPPVRTCRCADLWYRNCHSLGKQPSTAALLVVAQPSLGTWKFAQDFALCTEPGSHFVSRFSRVDVHVRSDILATVGLDT